MSYLYSIENGYERPAIGHHFIIHHISPMIVYLSLFFRPLPPIPSPNQHQKSLESFFPIKTNFSTQDQFSPINQSPSLVTFPFQPLPLSYLIQTINLLMKHSSHPNRPFRQQDIPILLQKIFSEFDSDKNQRFSKTEFPRAVKTVINLVGGQQPSTDDIQDIFNLLDVNGDQTIDRREFKSLITTFFQILRERNIEVGVQRESDIKDLTEYRMA